jgi:hypothetical protein
MQHLSLSTFNLDTLYKFGFGSWNGSTLIKTHFMQSLFIEGNTVNFMSPGIFVNLPQAILSVLYLAYNNLFSCMVGAHEWSGFGRFRQPLRVSLPIKGQKSLHYLQLPYTYSIVCYFFHTIHCGLKSMRNANS